MSTAPLFFDSTGDATRGHVVGSTIGDPMSEAGPHPLLHERFGGLWAASTA